MFERLTDLETEYAQLERDLSDPAIHSDPDRARAVGRRYGELGPIISVYQQWRQAGEDEATARELSSEDSSFAAEADQLAQQREQLQRRLEKRV